MAVKIAANADGRAVASTKNITTPATTSYWIKCGALGSADGFSIGVYDGNTGANGYGLYFQHNTRVLSSLFGGVTVGSTSITLTDSVWTHLAYTRNGTSYTFYVNGSSVNTEARTVLGDSSDSGDSFTFFEGTGGANRNEIWLAEIAYWDQLLTIDQIGALAKGMRPPKVHYIKPRRYWPCVRWLNDPIDHNPSHDGSWVLTGSPVIADHPRMYG